MSRLGTTWVAPGEGSTLGALRFAAGIPVQAHDSERRTNLLLTGEPWREYDTERLAAVEVVPLGAWPFTGVCL